MSYRGRIATTAPWYIVLLIDRGKFFLLFCLVFRINATLNQASHLRYTCTLATIPRNFSPFLWLFFCSLQTLYAVPNVLVCQTALNSNQVKWPDDTCLRRLTTSDLDSSWEVLVLWSWNIYTALLPIGSYWLNYIPAFILKFFFRYACCLPLQARVLWPYIFGVVSMCEGGDMWPVTKHALVIVCSRKGVCMLVTN